MAIIETGEGQTLIVKDNPRKRTKSLYVKGTLDFENGFGKNIELKVWEVYNKGAYQYCDIDRPRTRGDLTVEVMRDLANRVIGYAVAEGWADRRSEVSIERLTVEERDEAKHANKAYVPNWEDDWPEDGSQSEKVRYILDNNLAFTDEEIAAGVGCSRSLVADIKRSRD